MTQPLELWTAATPNGWKVSIMIEELRELGIALPSIEVITVDIMSGEQFSNAFTAVSANQKIPGLVHGGIKLMESCAILQYLGEQFPSSLYPSGADRYDVLQWLTWQAAGLGPTFGNKLSYTRYMGDVPDEQKVHPLTRFNVGGSAPFAGAGHATRGKMFCLRRGFHHRRHRDFPMGPWVQVEQNRHYFASQCACLEGTRSSATRC